MYNDKQSNLPGIYQPLRIAEWFYMPHSTLLSVRRLALLLILLLVSGCNHLDNTVTTAESAWIQDVINYRQTPGAGQPNELDTILTISEAMRTQVRSRFSGIYKHSAAEGIALWLLDEDGIGMRYDVTANLTPIEAFEQKRGNCLSFTLLLNALAAELGINIEFNAVDIPNTWGMDEQLGMVFYRHVNGVLTTHGRRQIFDLAMDIYDAGYPQRFISRNAALALLQANKSVDLLAENKVVEAIHPQKLAISLNPQNADLWANLGVLMKRNGKPQQAELSFRHGLTLDRYNIPAASNLERMYREQGQTRKAQALQKQVERARRSNPYHYYQLALDDYSEQRYKGALRSTNAAIRLHKGDPRFYELKSLIAQQQHNYRSALKSLGKAYELAAGSEQRGKYASKAELISQKATEEYARRWQEQNTNNTIRQLQRQMILN